MSPRGRITGLNSPYRQMPGHLNSQYYAPTQGWVVVYVAKKDQRVVVNEMGGKYLVVCEVHGRWTQKFTRDLARRFQAKPTLFCLDCQALVKKPIPKKP